MPAPTNNDWNSFRVETFENKVNVLFYYLCQGGYNMQEIATQVLRTNNQHGSQRVSLITRCYGFEGKNGGAFRTIGATREDVAAFVREYPNGCSYDGEGQVMRAYLQKRVQARYKPQGDTPAASKVDPMQRLDPSLWKTVSEPSTLKVDPTQRRDSYVWQEVSSIEDIPEDYGEYESDSGSSGNIISDKAWNVLGIVVIIAVFGVCKFVLDWNWIVSVIVALVGSEVIMAVVARVFHITE